jgi:hypothetical protein
LAVRMSGCSAGRIKRRLAHHRGERLAISVL